MTQADDYNLAAWRDGRLKPEHLTELVLQFQRMHGLTADGMAGPKTRAMLELLHGRAPGDTPHPAKAAPPSGRGRSAPLVLPDIAIDAAGWMSGAGVKIVEIHASRMYPKLSTSDGRPKAIVAHYTATKPGTGLGMFTRMKDKIDTDPNDGDGVDREVSWHISIETDGAVLQGASLLRGCWHAGGRTAKAIPGVGRANRTAVGVELVGMGDMFPRAQVLAACRVWRALVKRYGIEFQHAMIGHSEIDPGRKRDPGPVWVRDHQAEVLGYAFPDP